MFFISLMYGIGTHLLIHFTVLNPFDAKKFILQDNAKVLIKTFATLQNANFYF